MEKLLSTVGCSAFCFIVIQFIIVKKKADINDYFFYNRMNIIFMKIFIKRKAKNYSYLTNKRKMLEGWNDLPKNCTFTCITHEVMKKYIEKMEKKGKVKIIKCKRCFFRKICLTCMEKKLGKKENFSGWVTGYKIKFRTI